MKKLYREREVLFAVLWILLYCFLTIPIRGKLGDESVWMLAALLAVAVGATAFVRSVGAEADYGLKGWPEKPGRFWYFLPMFALTTGNLWGGVAPAYPLPQLIYAILSMLLVGYVEELIFRGFLFKALLKKDGPLPAILISAVSFGIGHIVNLLAGQASLETVLQVVFAISWGFLFTFAFYKGGSLWPCIIVHGLVDTASVFSANENLTADYLYIAAVILVALVYCPYLSRLETARINKGC